MSILIKGVAMPNACIYRQNGHLTTCPLYDIDGYCGALGKEASHEENNRHSDCPLIELPPHGRLIDADAMIVSVKRQTDVLRIVGGDLASTGEILERGILQEIKNTPTIIEAEGE